MKPLANMRNTPFSIIVRENHYRAFITQKEKCAISRDIVCKLGSNCIYLHIVYTVQHFFNPTKLSYTKAISADCLRTYLVTAFVRAGYR